MTTAEALVIVRRILNQIADGIRPNADDRSAVRIAETRGYIVKNYTTEKFELTAKGQMLVNSGRAHSLI